MKSIVILRYLLADSDNFFEKSRNPFDKVLNGEVEISIKEIVIAEAVYVLERVYKVQREEISEILENLISLTGIKAENRDYLLKAFKIYKGKKLDFVDCVLCSMAEDYKIETFDKELNRCIDKND